MGDGATLQLEANLSTGEIARERRETPGALIWGPETGDVIPPYSVSWRVAAG